MRHWLGFLVRLSSVSSIFCLLPITCLMICLKETELLWWRMFLKTRLLHYCGMFVYNFLCLLVKNAVKTPLFFGAHKVFVDMPERIWVAMA